METAIGDPKLVAYCGLYCGACGKFKKGGCPGCAGNEKASWCEVRKCNIAHGFSSCAVCTEFSDVMDCKKFNNFFSKVFALVFRSDRAASIKRIKEVGLEVYAKEMAAAGRQVIRKQ
jgi:hypothetical protein